MPKKALLFLVLSVFFINSHIAHAGLVINEVMYDLSGSDSTSSKSREWIEVYNSDATDVAIDGATWRIYDGGANRTINDQVNFSIAAGAYVILAGDKDTFLADHAGFSGTVYDTGITSLNNTGATLKILNAIGDIVDLFTYTSSQGGAGDGNTLQKLSSGWSAAVPTPGEANEAVTPSASSTGSGSSGGGSSSSTVAVETKPKIVEPKKIKVQMANKPLGFVDIPLQFQATAYGYNGETLYYGKYFWNFGDGDSREVKATGAEKFAHIYYYPGTYTVSLEYFTNYYGDTPDAVAEATIRITPEDVSISNVGDDKDFFVELANNTAYDSDISKWVLSSASRSYTLPRNTIIEAKSKMTISGRITKFTPEDKDTLKLANSEGEIVFDYKAFNEPVVSASTRASAQRAVKEEVVSEQEETKEDTPGARVAKPVAVPLEAEVLDGKEEAGETIGKPNSYLPMVGLAAFLGVTSGTAYFIRRRRITGMPGEDFDILDE
jgi:hypothetical protein